MRVLVVEDDAALGAFLQRGLRMDGHTVTWVLDGEAALDCAANDGADMMLLDLGLPKRDGVEVLAAIEGRFPQMAVMVLTARAQVSERVQCLNLGADDILLKPFSLTELMARCRAVMRRKEQFADPVLRAGDVELNRMERKVTRSGKLVDLTVKEFCLLEFLMRRKGQCCGRGDLLREVWQMSPDAGTNVVDVYVNYLRKKLAAAHPAIGTGLGLGMDTVIETVRGEGYRVGGQAVGTVPVAAMKKAAGRVGVRDAEAMIFPGFNRGAVAGA